MNSRSCLPINGVLAKVTEIEQEVTTFYERARELVAADPEVARAFSGLLGGSRESLATIEQVCAELKCGEAAFAGASPEDLGFLTALAEGSFYRRAGRPAALADPALSAEHLLDRAIKIEKDLLLFYLKFLGLSCADHRPLFSELIQRGQQHIGTLQRVRTRLLNDRTR